LGFRGSGYTQGILAVLQAEFAAIHKTIAKIEAIEKLPLPDAPEATPIDPAFLQKLASEGRESLPVQVGNQIIDLLVREVLSRIETGRTIRVNGNIANSTIIPGDENKSEQDLKPARKRKS